ncbi:MAG: ribosome maturation factor RimM [Desulfohalobiaceae bacterium]
MSQSAFLILGRVRKPHGLKGEFRVESYADSPFLFESLPRVYLKREGRRPQKFLMESVRYAEEQILLRLEGIESRQRALDHANAEIWVRKRDLPQLEPNEVYLSDLAGFAVYLPDGTRLGTLENADEVAGQEMWTIRTREGSEVLFPARDELVPEMDLHAREVVIDPPQGLLEVYGVRG